MDFMTIASDPMFWVYAGVFMLIGILIGWLFTRRGWRRRLNEAEERLDSVQAAHRRELRELEEQGDPSEQVRQLTAQVEELQASLKAAQDELDTVSAGAKQMEAERDALRAQVDEAEADKATVRATEEPEVEELVVEAPREEESVDAGEGPAADSAANVAAMEKEVEELQAQLAQFQQEFDSASEDAASELGKARTEIEAAAAARIALENELAAARDDAGAARQELDALRAQIEETGTGSQNKEIALNEAYEHAAAVQNKLKNCQEEVATARSNLKEMQEKVSKLEGANEELHIRVQQSRSDVAGDLAVLTSTMLKIKDDALNEANARIAQLTEEVDRLRVQGR